MARLDRRIRLPLLVAGCVLLGPLGWACSEPEPPRNAVLVLLDTLRADRLSGYGYPRATSPALDHLASQGVLFETVVSSGSWTLPGMAGIFAGDFPNGRIYDGSLQQSLVEPIQAAGFRTAAFVEGGFVAAAFGFDRGFDEFENLSQRDFLSGADHEVVLTEQTFAAAQAWLREHADRPFFLVVHSYEPHTPYTRRRWARGMDSGALGESFHVLDAARIQQGKLPFGPVERRYVGALYDGGIRASDNAVASLLRTLSELGIRDQTLVVVTSDHGEDIGGREPEWPGIHGHNLYDELVLVPLIIHDPTRRYPTERVTQQVRTIDVMHTILDLLGLAEAPSVHGKSLVPLMEGTEGADRFAWSKTARMPFFDFEERYALRTGAHKLILTRREDGGFDTELYDLPSDPGERANQAETDRPRAERLRKLLLGLRDQLEQPGPARYTIRAPADADAVEARLRALGYAE